MKTHKLFALATALLACACGDDSASAPVVPDTYSFPSSFASDESSVSYSGQVFRQVLITELTNHIEALTGRIDTPDGFAPVADEVKGELGFFYEFDGSVSGSVALSVSTTPGVLQTSYDDIASGKDLRGKIAGNDEVGQHKDWATEFVGWTEGGVTSPDGLVQHWFGLLDQLAVDRANGVIPTDPGGTNIATVYVTGKGQDLKQLVQKFLLGSVALSQGLDDYLDDATPDKGIKSSNERDGDKPYTVLEHQWDEGFGYFGAARDYNDYTDEELASKGGRAEYQGGHFDSNGDNSIDLLSEFNFSFAINAGKRDRGSADSAKTDFTKTIFDAFLTGRAIINSAQGELSAEEMTDLEAQRDIIAKNWEALVAAQVVHYINETLRDMSTFDTTDYSFGNHAKHWSELKGFSLSLQFSPFSPLTDAQFAKMQDDFGDAPILPGAAPADITAYRQALLDARATIGEAFDFDAANLGDDNGENGW